MRPYLAILKDSFREAMASRILWLLLAAITLALVAIAPVGIKEESTWRLRGSDFYDAPRLVQSVVEPSESTKPGFAKHVWSLLKDETQQQWTKWSQEDERSRRRSVDREQVAQSLNELLTQRDFYDEAAWKDVPIPPAAQELLDRDRKSLSNDELARMNRRLFDAALPDSVRAAGDETFIATYAIWSTETPFARDREAMNRTVDMVVMTVMTYVVGVFGVFVAILVTASMIPHTFDAGAIDLLLSKPISRTLMFLTKYLGGCFFILLNAAYFLAGLWLIAGLRLGHWNHSLLLCIPVFLFLFAIYYAVSALSGVIWGNAIVSIALTIIFWAACFTVGTSRNVIHTLWIIPKQHERLVTTNDELVAVTKQGAIERWDAKSSNWKAIMTGSDVNRPGGFAFGSAWVGPVFDEAHDRLLAIPKGFTRVGRRPQQTLVVGKRSDDWKRVDGTKVPPDARELFIDPEGNVLVVCTHGVFQLIGDLETQPGAQKRAKIAGIELPFDASENVTNKPIAPDPWNFFSIHSSVAIDPRSGDVAACNGNILEILERKPGEPYASQAQVELEVDDEAIVGIAGGTILLATAKGRILAVDRTSHEVVHTYSPFGDEAPRQVAAGPDGRWFAVLFHDGNVSLYDATARKDVAKRLPTQGSVTAVAFSGPGKLLIADEKREVVEVELESFAVTERCSPGWSTFERVYYYVIDPMYFIFPKPGELSSLVHYLLIKEETVALGPGDQGLKGARAEIDVWTPVWSCLAFVGVVLGIGSIYVARKDF